MIRYILGNKIYRLNIFIAEFRRFRKKDFLGATKKMSQDITESTGQPLSSDAAAPLQGNDYDL